MPPGGLIRSRTSGSGRDVRASVKFAPSGSPSRHPGRATTRSTLLSRQPFGAGPTGLPWLKLVDLAFLGSRRSAHNSSDAVAGMTPAGSKPVAGGQRSATSGHPVPRTTRPRRVSKQITSEPSDPTGRPEWAGITISSSGNADCGTVGGMIRCDPVRGRRESVNCIPEVALR